MTDFFEIDFLKIDEKKSGDAISIRYKVNEHLLFHVVDGGFEKTGDRLRDHDLLP